jgi:alpha-methylacyl-CoA racemase
MRVIDLSRLLPGPYCTRILADFGYQVIKVEPPGEGDWLRNIPPFQDGVSTLFQALNHDKLSLTVNLKSPQGREIFLKLIETADVLLESFRPDVMEQFGLGYEQLVECNPHLVYCSLTGYGHAGDYRLRPGHDLNYIGLSGLLDLTGERSGAPVIPGTQLADITGALWAVIGIQQALLERERTGLGQRVDTSLLGAALSLLPVAVSRQTGLTAMERGASDLTGGWVCYQIYETQRQGEYLTLGALESKFWRAFCLAVGRDDLIGGHFTPALPGEPVYEQLCTLFKSRTRDEWINLLAEAEACCEPVYNLGEALKSQPVQALEMVVGESLLPPLCFNGRRDYQPGPAPEQGEHTEMLLKELGYTQAEIRLLKNQQIV